MMAELGKKEVGVVNNNECKALYGQTNREMKVIFRDWMIENEGKEVWSAYCANKVSDADDPQNFVGCAFNWGGCETYSYDKWRDISRAWKSHIRAYPLIANTNKQINKEEEDKVTAEENILYSEHVSRETSTKWARASLKRELQHFLEIPRDKEDVNAILFLLEVYTSKLKLLEEYYNTEK